MLQVTELSRFYGDVMAVDRVDFTISKGEIVGLLGHNGAGKTTIMKMLSGYLEPNRGSVVLDGVNLADNPRQVQQNLGYLPENLPIYPEMAVADYLDYTADLKGLGAKKAMEIKRVIKATELTDKLLLPIATLSRGYKQRVGVAQALLGQPKLLILDEPTNGLDPQQTQQMRQLIREIAKDATVILSTHIMQEVEALCHRVLILRAGQLALDSTLDELRHSNCLLLQSAQLSKQVLDTLAVIEGVSGIEQNQAQPLSEDSLHHYQIDVSSNVDMHHLSAEVARQIIKADAPLYRLQPEQRDLETLFREVNEQVVNKNELNYAA